MLFNKCLKELLKAMAFIFTQFFSICFFIKPNSYFTCKLLYTPTEITLLMKRMHFMGTNFNTRGRITVKGIEKGTPEDEVLSCQSVRCYTLPFAFQMVGKVPVGEADPSLR